MSFECNFMITNIYLITTKYFASSQSQAKYYQTSIILNFSIWVISLLFIKKGVRN